MKEAEVDVQLLLIPYCAVGYEKYRSNLGPVPMFEMRRLQEYMLSKTFVTSFFSNLIAKLGSSIINFA